VYIIIEKIRLKHLIICSKGSDVNYSIEIGLFKVIFCISGGVIMKYIIPVVDSINRLISWILVLMMAFLSVLVFFQVLCRNNIINISIPWSEETARYILIWIAFLGSSLAIRRNLLINLDTFVNAVPKKIRTVVIEVSSFLTLAFIVTIIYCGILFLKLGIAQIAPSLNISMGWAYAALPVGGVLMLINAITNSLERWGIL